MTWSPRLPVSTSTVATIVSEPRLEVASRSEDAAGRSMAFESIPPSSSARCVGGEIVCAREPGDNPPQHHVLPALAIALARSSTCRRSGRVSRCGRPGKRNHLAAPRPPELGHFLGPLVDSRTNSSPRRVCAPSWLDFLQEQRFSAAREGEDRRAGPCRSDDQVRGPQVDVALDARSNPLLGVYDDPVLEGTDSLLRRE